LNYVCLNHMKYCKKIHNKSSIIALKAIKCEQIRFLNSITPGNVLSVPPARIIHFYNQKNIQELTSRWIDVLESLLKWAFESHHLSVFHLIWNIQLQVQNAILANIFKKSNMLYSVQWTTRAHNCHTYFTTGKVTSMFSNINE
jgi:hypothetical protein